MAICTRYGTNGRNGVPLQPVWESTGSFTVSRKKNACTQMLCDRGQSYFATEVFVFGGLCLVVVASGIRYLGEFWAELWTKKVCSFSRIAAFISPNS